MAYFTAVIARAGSAWKARDVEIEEFDDLDDLADALRAVSVGDEPVLAVVEHEDEWFALVRVEADEEPRVFVSDLPASAHSHYGPLLAAAGDIDADEEIVDDRDDVRAPEPVPDDVLDVGATDDDGDDPVLPADDDADLAVEEVVEPDGPVLAAWAGDVEVLDDLGVPGRTLRKLAEERGDDPAAVLAELGEAAGFAELIEALR